jgi:DnaJ homolog subfamily C member 22
MGKSIKAAYFFYALGGILGWHHIYLGRDKKALVSAATFGEFFIGYLIDLFKIPEYVREANEKTELSKDTDLKIKAPAFFTTNFICSIIFGSFCYYILKNAVTEETYTCYLIIKILSPLFIAILVYWIGTEGPMKCEFKWPLLGSYLAFLIDGLRNSQTTYNTALVGTLFLNWNIEWDHDYFKNKTNKKSLKRFAYISIAYICIYGLIGLFIWNNASLEIHGKKVTLKESVITFLNSEELVKLKEVFKMIWNYYKAHGLAKLINHFFYGVDSETISNAYKVNIQNNLSAYYF